MVQEDISPDLFRDSAAVRRDVVDEDGLFLSFLFVQVQGGRAEKASAARNGGTNLQLASVRAVKG